MAETASQGGITMLDGAALVTGAAVASVHFKEFTEEMASLTFLGWLFLCVAFGWLAVTAAGPFVYLVRRFSRRPAGYPTLGDALWMAYGLPWLVAALFLSAAGNSFDTATGAYTTTLFVGLFATAGVGVWALTRAWPRLGADPAGRASSWTDVIGRAISIAWPLQLGLGFVVTK